MQTNDKGSMSGQGHNLLASEMSPYLLQHKDNPVHWWPWCDAAFQKASDLNRPVFVSIGYSTCHWCHVMAHESFENDEIAHVLNEKFVAIKVDREERPDVDKAYMTFVQALSGQTGWPLSVFVTPTRAPFLGGTYFPPKDTPNQSGFLTVLNLVAEKWSENPDQTAEQAKYMADFVNDKLQVKPAEDKVDVRVVVDKTFKYFEKAYDKQFGGFGFAPKFPEPSNYVFLSNYSALNRRPESGKAAYEMAVKTLHMMDAGGIHDHIGCGFHRYSVDPKWHVPHFEKMLYDQAQLLQTFARVQRMGASGFERVVTDIVTYLKQSLLAKPGAFYSAEDADSLSNPQSTRKTEGAFYVWTRDETDEELEDVANVVNENITYGELFATTYNVEIEGNVPSVYDQHDELSGQNVLIRTKPIDELAKEFNMSEKDYMHCLDECRRLLRERRDLKKPRPHRDNKVITGWNALTISGLVEAAKANPAMKPDLLGLAENAAKFVEQNLFNGPTELLRSTFVSDEGTLERGHPIPAVADDYAYMIKAYLDLFEITFKDHYLKQALGLQETLDKKFWDNANNSGYFLNEASSGLYTRPKSDQDGAEPSYNSVALENLARLDALLDWSPFEEKAHQIAQGHGELLKNNPHAVPYMVNALDRLESPGTQIVIVTPQTDAQTEEAITLVHKNFIPHSTLILVDKSKEQMIVMRNKHIRELTDQVHQFTIQICHDYACTLPINSVQELQSRLNEL